MIALHHCRKEPLPGWTSETGRISGALQRVTGRGPKVAKADLTRAHITDIYPNRINKIRPVWELADGFCIIGKPL